MSLMHSKKEEEGICICVVLKKKIILKISIDYRLSYRRVN